MDALTEALVRLLKRQEETDRRLRRIEELLAIQTAEPAPPPVPVVEQAPPQPPSPELRIEPLPAPSAAIPHRAPVPELETQVGLTWVNRIGALTFILAVAFFFKLAVDNQWIGESGRVILGTLAGFATLAAAEHFFRKGHQLYAQGVCATGVGILYLSFYASFGFYQLVPVSFAFLLMVAAVGMAVVLALRYTSQAILVLGLIAGYATPILLSTGQDRPFVFFTYLFLLNGAALLAARSRDWRLTEIFAGFATWFLYLVWFADRFREEKRLPAVLFAGVFYVLFATSGIPILIGLSQLAAALAMTASWENHAAAYMISSGLLAASGFGIAVFRSGAWTANIALLSYILGYLIWTEEASSASRVFGLVFPGLTAVFALFFAWLPWRVLGAATLRPADYWVAAVNAAFYFSAVYELAESTGHTGYMGLLAIALAGLHLTLAYQLWRGRDPEAGQSTPALLAAGLAMCFATLAIPIQFSGATITIAWAVEVAAAGWLTMRSGSHRMLWVTGALFLLTCGRLFFYDTDTYGYTASGHALFANRRFLAFLISAIAFALTAWWLRPRVLAGLVTLGTHAAILTGVLLEMSDWTQLNVPLESLMSVRSALLSVITAGYGVILIAAGVAYRVRFHRAVGLVLISVVILKLYLYDVWFLLLAWRVIAFAALGALLLLTSYFYSRHRSKIEALWNQQDGDSLS